MSTKQKLWYKHSLILIDSLLCKIHPKSPTRGPKTSLIAFLTFPQIRLCQVQALFCYIRYKTFNLTWSRYFPEDFLVGWRWGFQQFWRPHQDPAESTLPPWLKISTSELEFSPGSLEPSFWNGELYSMLSTNSYFLKLNPKHWVYCVS